MPDNVEIARRAIEAWNKGGPDLAMQYAADDHEYHDPPTLPDSRVIRGREAVAAHFNENAAVLGELRFVVRHALPCGEGAVLLLMETELRGAGSGLELPGRFAQVSEFEDGKMRRTRSFLTWEEGLEAAGLSEAEL